MTQQSFSARATKLGAVALAATLLFTACSGGSNSANDGSGSADSDVQPVTLMLNWTPNAHHAGIYYAQEHGFYEELGLDLTIMEPSAEVGSQAAVAQGKVEFGISQAESVLPGRAAGMNVEAIAKLLPVNDSVLMGLKGSGFSNNPGSLAGLSYGGYGGALETEIMSQLTSCGGGDPASVEFIEIGNVDYLAGLAQDRFDVTWVFGGWDALRAQSERDDVVLLPMAEYQDCIPNWYTPVIIGNATEMAKQPELAKAFLEATSRGYEAVAADPAAGAAAMLSAVPELDSTLVTDAVAYYAPRYTEQGQFGTMEAEVWQRFNEFLVRSGMLENESALDGAWTNEYLPAE